MRSRQAYLQEFNQRCPLLQELEKLLDGYSFKSNLQNPNTHPILLWICNKLPATLAPLLRLNFLPKLRHSSRPAGSRRTIFRMMIFNDIMKCDKPAVPDEALIRFIVRPYTSVRMVSIDKQNIYLLICEHGGHTIDRAWLIRGALNDYPI